jgi:hypothetical protein
VAPAANKRTLEIEFSAPKGLPQPYFTVQASQRGNPQGDPIVFNQGTNALLSLPIEPSGGCYEIRITPTLVFAQSGFGEDNRELSVMLKRCGIIDSSGRNIDLLVDLG